MANRSFEARLILVDNVVLGLSVAALLLETPYPLAALALLHLVVSFVQAPSKIAFAISAPIWAALAAVLYWVSSQGWFSLPGGGDGMWLWLSPLAVAVVSAGIFAALLSGAGNASVLADRH